jgi:predicted nucleic acid-binding protein
MIYLDSSVALAHVFGEDRLPPVSLWHETLTSSRLLEYEMWTQVNTRGLGSLLRVAVLDVLDRVLLVDLTPAVLTRALEPFPVPVRTLDALHLATFEYIRDKGQIATLASYDQRLLAAARALGAPIFPGLAIS